MGLFPVYRLEEAEGLLKEGGGWGSDGALRARSYKTHPKPKLQGEAPRLFKGFILVFVFSVTTWVVTFFVLCGRNGATYLWRFSHWKRILNSVFCKIRGYNRKNLYPRIILIGIFCINVMVKLHQFSDNLYGTDFTELKNYLAACNAYEEPSQAKLQIVPRFAWCE